MNELRRLVGIGWFWVGAPALFAGTLFHANEGIPGDIGFFLLVLGSLMVGAAMHAAVDD